MTNQPDTPLLTDRFTEATAYALAHHRSQIRKGSGIPYASHLLAVTAIVLEMGGTEDEAIAAMLHDVVEDGGGPAAEVEIRERFGEHVAAMVRANSDTDVEPKPPWRARKEAYITGVATKDVGAVRVSIADKLHNARSIVADHRLVGDEIWDRFTASDTETLWYYEALFEAFDSRRAELGAGAEAALDELDRAIADLRRSVLDTKDTRDLQKAMKGMRLFGGEIHRGRGYIDSRPDVSSLTPAQRTAYALNLANLRN